MLEDKSVTTPILLNLTVSGEVRPNSRQVTPVQRLREEPLRKVVDLPGRGGGWRQVSRKAPLRKWHQK